MAAQAISQMVRVAVEESRGVLKMAYEKRIRYIEYWDNGNRIRSVGFVKIEVKNDYCNIQIRVNGVPMAENCTREVKAALEMGKIQAMIGRIEFKDGSGLLELKKVPIDRLCEGISYEALTEIRIILGKNRELICWWKEKQDTMEQILPERVLQEQAVQEQILSEHVLQEQAVQEQILPERMVSEQTQLAEAAPVQVPQVQEQVPQEQKMQVSPQSLQEKVLEVPETIENKQDSIQPPAIPHMLQDNKWKQLADIYPHIAPFQDDRDYLTIGPQDFVVLADKSYHLINNSFLLQGYYNYGHMILTRDVQKNEERFYLGVPGNFYEKERQAAIMFGFESFECRKEPVQAGDYGYFMIRVEL